LAACQSTSTTQIAVLVPPRGGPTQKYQAFKQLLNHREFGFSRQDLMLLKIDLEPHFQTISSNEIGKKRT